MRRHRSALALAAPAAAAVALAAPPAGAPGEREVTASSAVLAGSTALAASTSAAATRDLDWFLRATVDPADPRATKVDDFGDLDDFDDPLACDARAASAVDDPSLATRGDFLLTTDTGRITVHFGRESDWPLCGDWDGDGVDTPAVRRGSRFFLAATNTDGARATVQSFGRETDHPVVGDWNGDGFDTVGVVRGNVFHFSNVPAGAGPAVPFARARFGRLGDLPVIGDWDGDGNDTIGVVRGSTWHLSDVDVPAVVPVASTRLSFGRAETDVPRTGDWDGDGDHTPGMVRIHG